MYSYKRCIQLCKEDLLTYTDEQLYQLGGVMGIHLNKDRDQLAEEIATMLINKNWRSRKAHMLEAELPYAGDIRKAMQEPDRRVAIPAIRAIQAWRAEHERERHKELVKESQEKVVPEQAKDCSNEQDFITQDDWDADNLPQVKITLLDKTNPIHGPSYTLCFRRDTLQQWIGDPKHEMAVWLPTRKGKGMDADGLGLPGSKGTGPSANSIYTQLPDGSYTAVPENVSLFDPKYTNFIGVPIATNIRLGNLAATTGVSELHGQVPGKVTYLLIPAQDNLHNTLVTDFLYSLLDRQYVNEAFALLGTLQNTGLPENEIIDTFNNAIEESIITDPDWDQLVSFSQNEALTALASDKVYSKLPKFREFVQELNTNINYQNDEKLGAGTLQKIFQLLTITTSQNIDPSIVEDLVKAYKAISAEFYPAWVEDDLLKLIDRMTDEQLIKSSQELLDKYPAVDKDYDEQGQRKGPRGYEEEEQYPEDFIPLGGSETELSQEFVQYARELESALESLPATPPIDYSEIESDVESIPSELESDVESDDESEEESELESDVESD